MISDLQHQLIFKGNSPEQANLVMLSYTARMPCKEIYINGELMMRRYFMCNHTDGFGEFCGQEIIVQFMPLAKESHFHNDPFHAVSTVLVGSMIDDHLEDGFPVQKVIGAGDSLIVDPGFIHRISLVSPICWVHSVRGSSGLNQWFYLDGEERRYVDTVGADWWKDCKPIGDKR